MSPLPAKLEETRVTDWPGLPDLDQWCARLQAASGPATVLTHSRLSRIRSKPGPGSQARLHCPDQTWIHLKLKDVELQLSSQSGQFEHSKMTCKAPAFQRTRHIAGGANCQNVATRVKTGRFVGERPRMMYLPRYESRVKPAPPEFFPRRFFLLPDSGGSCGWQRQLERVTQRGSLNSGAGRPVLHSCHNPPLTVLEGAHRGAFRIPSTPLAITVKIPQCIYEHVINEYE